MSVHYELSGNADELQDKNVRVWHDGDEEPVYEGRYGHLLTEMADSYATDEDVGVIWNEMSYFDEDFSDETPRVVARTVFEGSRVRMSYLYRDKKHVVMLPRFDPGAPLYGRSGDKPYVSFQNWRCLEWWLAKEINIHCFLSWVADNMCPNEGGSE